MPLWSRFVRRTRRSDKNMNRSEVHAMSPQQGQGASAQFLGPIETRDADHIVDRLSVRHIIVEVRHGSFLQRSCVYEAVSCKFAFNSMRHEARTQPSRRRQVAMEACCWYHRLELRISHGPSVIHVETVAVCGAQRCMSPDDDGADSTPNDTSEHAWFRSMCTLPRLPHVACVA